MHATEWIQANARYKRTTTAVALRVGLWREVGHCTWCDGKFSTSKAARWCSAQCREEGLIRFGFWRQLVEKRDKGVCAICGFDSLACQERVRKIFSRAKGDKRGRHHPYTFERVRKFQHRTRISFNGQPYEIDHILPVIEGGGCCGLDNLRTLCFVCHRKQTASLGRRRAEERRDAKRPLLIG